MSHQIGLSVFWKDISEYLMETPSCDFKLHTRGCILLVPSNLSNNHTYMAYQIPWTNPTQHRHLKHCWAILLNVFLMLTIIDVVQDIAEHMLPLPTIQNLGDQVRDILISTNLYRDRLLHSHWLTYLMIKNRITLLIKSGPGTPSVMYHWHVFAVDKLRHIDLYSHHPKLLSQSTQKLHANFHRNKLSS